MKKVLISDYDNTFYINDEDIKKNKIAVSEFRKKGNIFVIATGRSYYDFKNVSNLYNLDYDYLIINHGATILDNNDNIFCNFTIQDEIIDEIKEDLNLNKSIKNFCCSKLESRVNFDYNNLTKINVKYNTTEDKKYVFDKINSKYSRYINIYNVTEDSIEIISNKSNKSKAINFLLDKIDLPRENAFTIGDGDSDFEMIREFNGYSMKNSDKKLKEVATKEYNSVTDLINEIMG